MAKKTAADIMLEVLQDYGVDTIFGLPGDGINGIMESLRKKKDEIKFIHVRHEEAAAFMATAYAKYTGKLGVCLSTSGPGGVHLLNGLYDAKLDGAPVLAITGLQFHDLLNTHTQQDVELDKLFMDVAVYNNRVMGAAHIENVTDLACRNAMAKKGVAHITVPVDFQGLPIERKIQSKRNVPGHLSHLRPAPSHKLPDADVLQAAADMINASKKTAILAGRGALHATDELLQLADLAAAPIIKALLGKAAVPDDSEFTTGGIGLLGTSSSQEAMADCDLLLIVGSSFPYIEFYPKPGKAKCIQIDEDASRIGLRYTVDLGMAADTKATLAALIPLLKRKEDRAFLHRAQESMKDWRELMKKRGERQDMPMKPQVVAWELGKILPENAIVSCDSGSITTWYARQIPAKRGQMYSLSGNLATMACGLPYAIGAAVAYPDRTSVAFVGDGGFSMLMAEISTAVKYNLNVKVVVIKNDSLAQIKWEQMVFLGNPEYGCDLQTMDYAGVARAMGAKAYTIAEPSQAASVLQEALNMPGPVVIEAVVDPQEPPLPGKITIEQAIKFSESIARGTPDAEKIIATVMKDKVKELI